MSLSARPSTPAPAPGGVAEQLARIIDTVERVADAVIDEAEERARRRLEEARVEADRMVEERLSSLSRLSDSLVAQAEVMRRQSDLLLASLEESRLGAGTAAPLTASASPVRLTAVEAGPPIVEETAFPGTLSRARVAATKMAVSGVGREEMDARLRTEFGIEDTASVLDAILGPEG